VIAIEKLRFSDFTPFWRISLNSVAGSPTAFPISAAAASAAKIDSCTFRRDPKFYVISVVVRLLRPIPFLPDRQVSITVVQASHLTLRHSLRQHFPVAAVRRQSRVHLSLIPPELPIGCLRGRSCTIIRSEDRSGMNWCPSSFVTGPRIRFHEESVPSWGIGGGSACA